MQHHSSRFHRLILTAAAASVALLALSAAHAQASPSASAPHAASVVGVGDEASLNISAKITRIMADTNSVEVKGPKGNLVVIDVNPSIADVSKLKVATTCMSPTAARC